MPSVPAYFYTGLPLQIFVEIRADGSLEPYYDQEERGDGVLIMGG